MDTKKPNIHVTEPLCYVADIKHNFVNQLCFSEMKTKPSIIIIKVGQAEVSVVFGQKCWI